MASRLGLHLSLLDNIGEKLCEFCIHINKRHASSGGYLITNDDEMMRYLNEPSIDRGIW
jgi:hypothetical protein